MTNMVDLAHTGNMLTGVRTMSEQIEWISTHEAAVIMQVELSTVSKLCRAKKIVCRQHGSGHRSVWEVSKQSALTYQKSVGGRPRKQKL